MVCVFVSSISLLKKRTASTAVAPRGPAERHLIPSSRILFMGASPPSFAALEGYTIMEERLPGGP
jgi:hypothetical protein